MSKRKRDATDDEPEAAAKKPKLDTFYVVTHLHFQDDYKCRGAWATEDKPKAFRSKRNAYSYVQKKETEFLHEWLSDRDDVPRYAKYFTGKGKLNEEAIEDDFFDLFDKAIKGEFVPETESWTVHELTPLD
jgi:hypothetical protein